MQVGDRFVVTKRIEFITGKNDGPVDMLAFMRNNEYNVSRVVKPGTRGTVEHTVSGSNIINVIFDGEADVCGITVKSVRRETDPPSVMERLRTLFTR